MRSSFEIGAILTLCILVLFVFWDFAAYFPFEVKIGDRNTRILKYAIFDIRIQSSFGYFAFRMILTDDVKGLSLFQQRFDKKTWISDFIDCSVDTGTCITEQFSIFFLCSIRFILVLVEPAALVSFAAVACARRAVTSFTDERLEGRTFLRTVVRILVRTFSGINALDRILGFVRENTMIPDFLAIVDLSLPSVSAIDFLEELFSMPR